MGIGRADGVGALLLVFYEDNIAPSSPFVALVAVVAVVANVSIAAVMTCTHKIGSVTT